MIFKDVKMNFEKLRKEVMEFFKGDGIARSQSNTRDNQKIQSFLDSVMRSLRLEGNCDVQLVFTHGDFCPANMLNTKIESE